MSASFVKKINTAPQLYKSRAGVKPYSNSQYAISSGSPSFDQVIGGGLPIGSLIILFEDSFSHYYAHFLKNYLGEGIVNEQKVLIVDADKERSKEEWLKFMPAVIKIKNEDVKGKDVETLEELKVAWRYNNLLKEGNNG